MKKGGIIKFSNNLILRFKILKKIYTAINEVEGIRELQNFSKRWDENPVISDIWQLHWSMIIVFFAFPEEIRKATMRLKDWSLALHQFEIVCGDFKYNLLENKI